jgi:hypothetical protein
MFDPYVPSRDQVPPRRFQIQRHVANSSERAEPERLKAFGIALWNVNAELRIGPQDPFLLQEVALVPTDIKGDDHHDPEKCQMELVDEAAISAGDGTLAVTIDGRRYPEVSRICVSVMEDPHSAGDPLCLRIGTFTAIRT